MSKPSTDMPLQAAPKRTPTTTATASQQAAQVKAAARSAQLSRRNELIMLRIGLLQEHFDLLKSYTISRWIRNVTEWEESHTQRYGTSNGDTNHCTICHETMQHAFKLPCSGRHRFCQKCIIAWLEKSQEGHRCPLCRDDVTEWFQMKRYDLCRKVNKYEVQRVRGIVDEVEREMGMKRAFWTRVKDEEVYELIDTYEMREGQEREEKG